MSASSGYAEGADAPARLPRAGGECLRRDDGEVDSSAEAADAHSPAARGRKRDRHAASLEAADAGPLRTLRRPDVVEADRFAAAATATSGDFVLADDHLSLSSSGEEDDEEFSDEVPDGFGGTFDDEVDASQRYDEEAEEDSEEDDDASDSEQPTRGASGPPQAYATKVPSLPATLRRLLHALAKRLLQQPDLRAFAQELRPLSGASAADTAEPASNASQRRSQLPSVGSTYTEAVRLVALLLKEVGPGGCVPPQLLELIDECVARAGPGSVPAAGQPTQPGQVDQQGRARDVAQSSDSEETRVSEAAMKAAEAAQKMEDVQWQLWRDIAGCTSNMRGQICCQSIDRLLAKQQIQAAVWEGSSKLAAWRLGASDCQATAALVIAKVLLSLQISLRSALKKARLGRGRREEEDEEEEDEDESSEDDDEVLEPSNGADYQLQGGELQTPYQREGRRIWGKALAKVPRDIRSELEATLLFCLRKKKMPPPLLVQLYVALNRRNNLPSCLGIISNFCRVFPSATFFRDVQVELFLLQVGVAKLTSELSEAQRHAPGGNRLDSLFSGLFQLIGEDHAELQRTQKALTTAGRRFIQAHCGSEGALQRLSEFWSYMKKREQLDCLMLALELRPACTSSWWRLALFLTSESESQELGKMRHRVQSLIGRLRGGASPGTLSYRKERLGRFARRFFCADSCSLNVVPEAARVALLFCAPFFLESLQSLLELTRLIGAVFTQSRPQLLVTCGNRFLKGFRGRDFVKPTRRRTSTSTRESREASASSDPKSDVSSRSEISLGERAVLPQEQSIQDYGRSDCEAALEAFDVSNALKTEVQLVLYGFVNAVQCFFRVRAGDVLHISLIAQLALESMGT
ncbi:hypothetical protein BESB_010670 [Besnoitia besnoiti]|uniref:Uncharacterized protein n=1 Tax=Besnoitia besnoiti TaxID=94643 RepID=A0A2A9ML32_BESBE|nr:hypothetical protein BESB_010670 [Besnoitia besnoiti]PFH38725.1 hypothetical protein BESB_010670 [Besnoitia besnoiti]